MQHSAKNYVFLVCPDLHLQKQEAGVALAAAAQIQVFFL